LILRKISKIGATRRQILRLNAPNSISAPDPVGGAYSAPPYSLAIFKVPTSKGGWNRKGERKREDEGKGREGWPPMGSLDPHIMHDKQ